MIRKLALDKRENFLNAALKLFVANGVQNTSTAAIAKEAGTASGTLFLYFPTKQDLLDELVRIGKTDDFLSERPGGGFNPFGTGIASPE